MTDTVKIGVVIPCYRVTQHIDAVISNIPEIVDKIYVIDDACPQNTGDTVRQNIDDHRITILSHEENQGVGGAVMTGYEQALKDDMDIVVKIDGDGQMNPALISLFIRPIIEGRADYTKGNRFYFIDDVRSMPGLRIFGNAVLSFMTKLSSGYWHLFDPTNGFTAIHKTALSQMPLDKIAKRYFFESDILFRLNIARAVIEDIPMRAVYNDEESGLKIGKIVFPFLKGHIRNFFKRVFYNYYLRDFSLASIQLALGIPILLFGLSFGVWQWMHSAATGEISSAGTVMLSALPIIIGFQMLLSFLQHDIQAGPRNPLQKKL